MELETLEPRIKAERCSGGRVFSLCTTNFKFKQYNFLSWSHKTTLFDWYLFTWWQANVALKYCTFLMWWSRTLQRKHSAVLWILGKYTGFWTRQIADCINDMDEIIWGVRKQTNKNVLQVIYILYNISPFYCKKCPLRLQKSNRIKQPEKGKLLFGYFPFIWHSQSRQQETWECCSCGRGCNVSLMHKVTFTLMPEITIRHCSILKELPPHQYLICP